MNWDTRELIINAKFDSEPLTITGIKKVKLEGQDCYKVKVKEDITYLEGISSDLIERSITHQSFYVYLGTFGNRNQGMMSENDAFYYFVNQFGKGSKVEIPFEGAFFQENKWVFCLSQKVNEIIKEEKKKWKETGYEKDLKFENKALVDDKYEKLHQNASNSNKEKDAEIERLKRLVQTTQEELERSKQANEDSQRKIQETKNKTNDLEEKIKAKDEEMSRLNQKIQSLKEKNNALQAELKEKNSQTEKLINQLQIAQEILEKLKQETSNQEEIKKLKAEVKKLKEELDKNRDATNSLMSLTKNLQKEIEKELTKGKTLISNLQAKIDVDEKLIKTLRGENDKLKEDLVKSSLTTDQAKRIEELEREITNKKTITSNLQDENKKLREKITLLTTQQNDLERIKSLAIVELENLMRGSDSKKLVTSEQLLEKLKNDGKLSGEINDWKEYIQTASSYKMANDRKNEIQISIKELQKGIVINPDNLLEGIKSSAILDIKRALNKSSLEEKDIFYDYQRYAEKINNLNEEQTIKDFASRIINYLKTCQELNSILSKTKEFINEEDTLNFEDCRQTRQKLDDWIENRSEEEAFKTINRNGEVDLYRKNIANYLWEFLKREGLKAAKDPMNENFLEELKQTGHEEGTEKFEFFWTAREIVKRFSDKYFEGKELPVSPIVHGNVYGSANLTSSFIGDRIVSKSYLMRLDFKKASIPQLLSTLPHELSHFVMYWRQFKGELPGGSRGDQRHSKSFWNNLFYDKDSTFSYQLSVLPLERYQELKEITDVLVDTKVASFRNHYFPESRGFVNTVRFKKYFDDKEAVRGWNFATQNALEVTDEQINADPTNWTSGEIRDKNWVQMLILHKSRNLSGSYFPSTDESSRGKWKTYVFYDENIAPKELKEGLEKRFNDWTVEHLRSSNKSKRIEDRLKKQGYCVGVDEECGCEIKNELQQEAQVVVNKPPFGRRD